MDFSNLSVLIESFKQLTWQNGAVVALGGLLIYLAISKDYEPVLLLPIGFGAILANLPLTRDKCPRWILGNYVCLRH